ncbi:MAG: DNA repair protein RecN, partial [Phycisphaerae bacterium]|nr:DNA repair protein RecN [Phycisphaerae bacterium]
QSLHISNLAVIASADVELAEGMNVFTGATGAGKSLLIGALEVLLGLRSAGELLRPGAEEARVSGVFAIRDARLAKQLAAAADMPLDGDELLLTRRIFANGRTAASVNGQPISVSMLKNLAELLVDIHGQHDHQYLLKPANQLELLDDFAGLAEAREKFAADYEHWRQRRDRRAELEASATLRTQQLELYEFQAQEIDGAELADGELEALQAEHRRLSNVEKLKRQAGEVYAALYEAEGSLLERLGAVNAVLRELLMLDDSLKSTSKLASASQAELEEVSFDLRRYVERLDTDPARLAEVEERLNLIGRLTDKYGRTIADVLIHRDQIEAQIAMLRTAESDFSQIDKDLAALQATLLSQADAMHKARVAAADRLAKAIESQLGELGMPKSKLVFEFAEWPKDAAAKIARMGPTGCDQVEALATTNVGQPPRPLRKIASGGEMSRIMLAIKGELARSDRTSVLVFDEIDANVGGRLGSVIGAKLSALGRMHQVLCITHLPQIAAFGDRQLTVRKEVVGKMTETIVRPIDGPDRIEELAEMIGGTNVTATTRKQAEEMLLAAATALPSKQTLTGSATPRRKKGG